MTLKSINKAFAILSNNEKENNYKYEPISSKEKPLWKRHTYFKDFQRDFIKEVTIYGFSPFIYKTFREQIKDHNITKYKPKQFNQGLINYLGKQKKTKKDLLVIQASSKNKNNKRRPQSTLPQSQLSSGLHTKKHSINIFTTGSKLSRNDNRDTSNGFLTQIRFQRTLDCIEDNGNSNRNKNDSRKKIIDKIIGFTIPNNNLNQAIDSLENTEMKFVLKEKMISFIHGRKCFSSLKKCRSLYRSMSEKQLINPEKYFTIEQNKIKEKKISMKELPRKSTEDLFQRAKIISKKTVSRYNHHL